MHTVDGGWSDWIPGICSVTCGNGTVLSIRECTNPRPAHGGKDCVGDNQYVKQCYKGCCPCTNPLDNVTIVTKLTRALILVAAKPVMDDVARY